MKRGLVLIILAVSIISSCKNRVINSPESIQEPVADSRGYIVGVGDSVPDFQIEYLDGKTESLSKHKGKIIMIQFTASWCGVCRKEMPHIEERIWKRFSGNPNFMLIGVDYKEDKETTEKFSRDMNITYPLTLDKEGERFSLFCGPDAGVTRNIIVAPDGKIIMLTRLFEEEEFNEMVELIASELNKIS